MNNQEHLAKIAKEQGREEFKKDKIEKIKKEIEIGKGWMDGKTAEGKRHQIFYIKGLERALEILERREK